jgi:hypothetical protein
MGYGPIDPMNYITPPKGKLSPLTADLRPLGRWMRTQEPSAHVNISYNLESDRIATLDPHSPLKVMAASGSRYRILLPDRRLGYIDTESVESLDKTLANQVTAYSNAIKEAPSEDAAVIESIGAGEVFSVLAKLDEFWLVKTQQGSTGWLEIPAAVSTEM